MGGEAMRDIGDHPEIANALRTGYPHGDPEYPQCPVCGSDCAEIYMDVDHVIVGCDECVTISSAWECEKCFRSDEL